VRTSPLRGSGVDHTVLPANTPHLPSPRNRSPECATTVCSNSSHLIAAYYSFVDPERMKGYPSAAVQAQTMGKFVAGQRPAFYHLLLAAASAYNIKYHQLLNRQLYANECVLSVYW